ncbi:MAG: hypothetical protein A2566_01940 [Candidatus Zambryskibacteria bacterium RIFOXYD1_FULL_40_13]|nr:MAG: Hydrolase, TatD family [Parcubacteria group bacterium GW2011_GWC1_39_12]KKR18981.1 MAG: Hydrolase, TatD family [Parcubacteria group bacterium GW2011_GWF1_39_37]KKR35464.1 MAG: Hydrolase, TatD family [Parcubacteria group bacterium GW2011_GWC2_40_10]KKR51954.1 MAG: Hydrolase, TatD family [Parcubacteria group bacterium GW2011_GWE1_40_20]KKR64877.1 MAG: Hydrolase, TatD family [Parcubacteria group bacterium GW2011_GWB1_40_5]KKR68532.1 MAG: Hydrolase, TatD family [Parcubacteria group bacteri
MFEYFDIHSHIDFPDFDLDREEEIVRIKEKKIGTTTVGVGFDSCQRAIALAEKHDNLFACVGEHPGDFDLNSVFDERLLELAKNPKVVSIGETGLDYYRLKSKDENLKKVQKKIFESQIDLSLSVSKPLMLHVRGSKGSQDAYYDALEILEHYHSTSGDKLKGNAHFFAGDMDVLKRFIAIGFTVSFTGVITFTNDYDELIKYTPLDMIMSETDAPFVAPVPHRGGRNSPLYVIEVVKKIAEIRNEPFDVVKTALLNNVLRHFPQISAIASSSSL